MRSDRPARRRAALSAVGPPRASAADVLSTRRAPRSPDGGLLGRAPAARSSGPAGTSQVPARPAAPAAAGERPSRRADLVSSFPDASQSAGNQVSTLTVSRRAAAPRYHIQGIGAVPKDGYPVVTKW